MENLHGIIKKRSTPGILIFDMNNRLLYSNKEALEMIPGLPKTVHTKGIKKQYVPKEIYNLCNQLKSNIAITNTAQKAGLNYAILNSSPGPPCSLRAFFIGGRGEDINATHIMVLIEKITERRSIDFEKVRKDFKLTNRELEVVVLLSQGLTNKEISERLFISEYTVKDHIKKIMRKMRVNSRNEIIAEFIKM